MGFDPNSFFCACVFGCLWLLFVRKILNLPCNLSAISIFSVFFFYLLVIALQKCVCVFSFLHFNLRVYQPAVVGQTGPETWNSTKQDWWNTIFSIFEKLASTNPLIRFGCLRYNMHILLVPNTCTMLSENRGTHVDCYIILINNWWFMCISSYHELQNDTND